MAVRPIVLYENNEAALRQKSVPFLNGSRETRHLVKDFKVLTSAQRLQYERIAAGYGPYSCRGYGRGMG